MVTETYIQRFLSEPQARPPGDRFFRWRYQRPQDLKILAIAAIILGSFLWLTSSSWFALSALVGGALVTTSSLSLYLSPLLAPSRFERQNVAFKPGRVAGGGELFYRGELPILTLNGDNPFLAGKAQGYLMGEAIFEIQNRFDTFLHTLLRWPRPDKIPQIIAQIKATLPPEYLLEMEGMVAGYTKWAAEQRRLFAPSPLTVDKLILSHLMPDAPSLKIGGIVENPFLREAALPACTALIDREERGGIVFGRNMDWPSLGLTGKYTFIRHRITRHRHTVDVAIAGLIGTLTGMNDQGLSLAMNVCPSKQKFDHIRGMPALFYNRRCLENCNHLAEVADFVQHNRFLGAYHLSVADRQRGASYHFDQGDGLYHLRPLEENSRPLATFNMRLGERGPQIDQGYSQFRQQQLGRFYQGVTPEMDRASLIKATLALPGINNHKTTHTILMSPGEKMQVSFDNAFSGDKPLLEVPLRELFARPPRF